MVKVFVHYRDGTGEWVNIGDNHFTRVPCVGEFLQVESNTNTLYKVVKVLHCDASQGEFEAEVVCTPDATEVEFFGDV